MYSWNLDSVGNWKSTTKVDTSDVEAVENRTHNRLHQLVEADGDYYYDANGNMIDTPSKWLTFDALNRLTFVELKGRNLDVEFRYDAQGRRIRKTVTNEATTKTDYIYSGLQCLEERDSENIMTKQYVWGHYVDELLQIKMADSNRFYPLQDLLYRTNALTDGYGNIVEKYDTDAYGNTLLFNADDEEIDTPTCEFIFTGRRLDVAIGLYYYRARYYNPSLGRFISRDPLDYIDGMGLYEYCKNIPTIAVDPNGDIGVFVVVGIIVALVGWIAWTIRDTSGIEREYKAKDPSTTDQDNLWWAWKLLKECEYTTYMADAIKDDLFFDELHIAESAKYLGQMPGYTRHGLTIWFRSSYQTNSEILLPQEDVDIASKNSKGRLQLASTLWHEYHHWKHHGSDKGATYEEILLTTKLWKCWCKGNKYIQKNVKPQELANIAWLAAQAEGHPVPDWVKQAENTR